MRLFAFLGTVNLIISDDSVYLTVLITEVSTNDYSGQATTLVTTCSGDANSSQTAAINLINLLVKIEKQYDLFFEDDEMMSGRFNTVEEITSLLVEKLGVAS